MTRVISEVVRRLDYQDGRFARIVSRIIERWDVCISYDDVKVEALIIDVLSELCENSGVLSEESYHNYSTIRSPILYFIDPIDGSHNRERSLPYFSISICKYVNGRASASMVFIPDWGTVYLADTLRAYKCGPTGTSEISVSQHRKKKNRVVSMFKREVQKLPPLHEKVRSISCSSIELCLLAQGSLDAFIDRIGYEKQCDVAAALYILEKAGGVFCYEGWGRSVTLPSEDWLIPRKLIAASTEECVNEYI